MKTSYETITGNENFDFNELKTVAKELNESGLAPKKINMVGCKKEEAVKRFLDAIEKIPDEDVQKMPDVVYELNNTFIDILDANDREGEKEEVEEEEEEEEVTEVSKKEEKAKVALTFDEVVQSIKKKGDKFMTNYINLLLLEGMTKEKLLAKATIEAQKRNQKEFQKMGSINYHIKYLRNKGFQIEEKDGKIKIVNYVS